MSGKDHSSMEDPELVGRAQKGDMEAFEELVARHRDKIYARAFSMMRNEEEAVDLSQEAWVKGWQRLRQFQQESSFGTWMTRIVINLCLDQLRKQKRHRTESIEAMSEESGGVERQMPVVTVNPTAGLERNELRQRIDQALGQLSYEHRTVLVGRLAKPPPGHDRFRSRNQAARIARVFLVKNRAPNPSPRKTRAGPRPFLAAGGSARRPCARRRHRRPGRSRPYRRHPTQS